MTPQDPLAALQPLREPPPLPLWWPPAPGWWLLAGLLLAAAAVGGWLLWRRWRRRAYRRQAATQLARLFARYEADRDLPGLLAATNALLKSVALCAFPREQVAALHGDDWVAFLNRHAAGDDGFAAAFASAHYRPQCEHVDTAQLRAAAARWIRRHRVAP